MILSLNYKSTSDLSCEIERDPGPLLPPLHHGTAPSPRVPPRVAGVPPDGPLSPSPGVPFQCSASGPPERCWCQAPPHGLPAEVAQSSRCQDPRAPAGPQEPGWKPQKQTPAPPPRPCPHCARCRVSIHLPIISLLYRIISMYLYVTASHYISKKCYGRNKMAA